MNRDSIGRIMRSLCEDNFKKMLRKDFPTKKIKNKEGQMVDIGDNSINWYYRVSTKFNKVSIKRQMLVTYILSAYRNSIYLDEDEIWLKKYSEEIM